MQATVASAIDRIGRRYGGSWAVEAGPWGITWADVIFSVLVLAIAWLVSSILLRVILKKAGSVQSDRAKTWFEVALAATRKPLALMAWVGGIYFSSDVLLGNDEAPAMAASIDLWIARAIEIIATMAVFWLLFRVVIGVQKKMQKRADQPHSKFDTIFVPLVGLAMRLFVLAVGLFVLQGVLKLPEYYQGFASKFAASFVIFSVAWLVIRVTTVIERSLLANYRMDLDGNFRARRLYSQVSVIRRIIIILVAALALACTLMLFQPVRQFGTSLLASAGILGIVIGFASQKALTNLIAGIQIAVSQPIRIDDVVIVEGEWGVIEEISLTYVTVCVWDLRRLVLPIQYFIENPFQNWTLQSSKLINSVFLYTDYTLPIEPLRHELRRLLENHPLWDGDCCKLQVTNSKPEAMELRCLMSSRDANKGWDLKCDIREGLVEFIRAHHPESLPRLRAEITRNGASPSDEKPTESSDARRDF